MSSFCHYLFTTITLGLLLRFSITSGKDLPRGLEFISLKLCGKSLSVDIVNVNEEKVFKGRHYKRLYHCLCYKMR